MDDHSGSQSVLSMFLKWGHSEGGPGMQFTLWCGNADALIWIYSRQGSCEGSEGGLFQSFLLALECKMFGSPSLQVPRQLRVSSKNGYLTQKIRCSLKTGMRKDLFCLLSETDQWLLDCIAENTTRTMKQICVTCREQRTFHAAVSQIYNTFCTT